MEEGGEQWVRVGMSGFTKGSLSALEVLAIMSSEGALNGGHLTSTGKDNEGWRSAKEACTKS